MPRWAACFSSALLLLLQLLPAIRSSFVRLQEPRPRERLRGILSRVTLSPQLHGDTTIRFSPNGKFLFIQDPAGVTLLSRDPLQLLARMDGLHAYPVRFSADSQTLTLVTFDLSMIRWRVSDGKQLDSRNLPVPNSCLSAALSVNGDLLGCYTHNLNFVLVRLDTGRQIFSVSVHPTPPPQAIVPIPLESHSFFSAPFGYFISHDLHPLANRGFFRFPIWFSPDGKFVIAGDDIDAVRINLATLAKENVPSEIRKRTPAMAGITLDGRALFFDRTKPGTSFVSALSTGNSTPLPSFSADSAELCSDSRHAVFRNSANSHVQIIDLQSAHPSLNVESLAADVFGNQVVVLTRDNILQLYRIGETKPFIAVRLPFAKIPPLRAANVDSAFTTISLSVSGAGSTFDVASGTAALQQQFFAGANLENPQYPLFFLPKKQGDSHQIVRGDVQTHSTVPAWTASGEAELHPSQTAFIEYSLAIDGSLHRVAIAQDFSGFRFHLRGLNPATGEQLWLRRFEQDPPIPFSDPQGDRIVLGWKARSIGAGRAVKDNPVVQDAYKHSKRMSQDSVFEVLEARTGKSIAAAFVQFGDGPLNFSSAFSVGNFLFLVKDDVRVTVMSLNSGKIVARVKGASPIANDQANLFALDQGSGRLGIYDMATGEKIEDQLFSDQIAYAHFSADGKKLLVLTQNQELFVLDMSQAREQPLAPFHPNEEPSDTSTDQPQ